MSHPLVRVLTPEEYALVEGLKLSEEQEKFLPSRLAGERLFQVWGLWKGGRLIGFIEVVGSPPLLWIARMGIDAEYQGAGYGAYLLQAVLERLRLRARITEVRAAVHPENLPAQHTFEKAGFTSLPPVEGEELVFTYSFR